MEYAAYLHKDKRSDYGVSFPDFPGCITAGRTVEEARQLAGEALALHLQGMIEDGETIPEPSDVNKIAENLPQLGPVMIFFVNPEKGASGKRVRFNVTALDTELAAIDRRAGEAGLNRSAYLVKTALQGSQAAKPSRTQRRKIRA